MCFWCEKNLLKASTMVRITPLATHTVSRTHAHLFATILPPTPLRTLGPGLISKPKCRTPRPTGVVTKACGHHVGAQGCPSAADARPTCPVHTKCPTLSSAQAQQPDNSANGRHKPIGLAPFTNVSPPAGTHPPTTVYQSYQHRGPNHPPTPC